jgi:drug/metabolite transporter (DMT)-like permease
MKVALVGLVLLAAVLHAAWNALVKQSGERLLTFAVIIGTGGLVYVPVALITGPPAAASFVWLAGSALVHLLYYAGLLLGYRYGDLGQVYPIARGTGPLLVAVLGVVVAREIPSVPAAVGIALVCAGIFGLAGGGGESARRAVPIALATGVMIALYTTCDGMGVRESKNALAYIAWLHVATGIPFATVVFTARRRDLAKFFPVHGKRAAFGGVVAAGAYSLVIWAMSFSPLAWVAALRETSVVIAAALGARLLGEPFGARRIGAAAVVAAGVVVVSAS